MFWLLLPSAIRSLCNVKIHYWNVSRLNRIINLHKGTWFFCIVYYFHDLLPFQRSLVKTHCWKRPKVHSLSTKLQNKHKLLSRLLQQMKILEVSLKNAYICTKGRDESRRIWCVDISINSLGQPRTLCPTNVFCFVSKRCTRN